MFCPYCRHTDSRVVDSRVAEDGASIRRRRQCPSCERRFTTMEQMQLMVVKKSGVVEPFVRDKVISGVRAACKGRPVTETDLAKLGQRVEDSLRASGICEVPSEDVGVAILGPLSELDGVAYLRFASVYKHYQSLADFASEIERLREEAPDHADPLDPRRAPDEDQSHDRTVEQSGAVPRPPIPALVAKTSRPDQPALVTVETPPQPVSRRRTTPRS